SLVDNNIYACIRAKNVAEAIEHLNSVGDEQGGSSTNREEKYRNYSISSIGIKNIVPAIYGSAFSRITNCYYTGLNDFIVFANQPSSLKALIDDVSEGKTLYNDSL